MQFIDDAEFQINIDLDNGARISSLLWRDHQITLPYRGQPHTHGWYALGPWAGRIRDGLIKDSAGNVFELPTNIDPPNALHGYGYTSSWQDIGQGRALLHLPAPYNGATLEQRIEVLDDAIRWSLEYDANGCDLPAWLGLHPWFARDIGAGNEAELIFEAEQMLQRDKDGLPNGKLITPPKQPWDDAFTGVRGVPAVVWEDVLRIDIESDAPWWVVYTEDSEGICVEPQTAPPDAANANALNPALNLDLGPNNHYVEALFVFNAL
jgi:aldose 1-epimerase